MQPKRRVPTCSAPHRQRVWTSMRVLRSFDWRDLAATAETSHSTVKQFLWGLKKAGLVLHRRSPYGPGSYVLLNDLGPHCPVVCTDAIYDPNHQAWIEYNQGAPK